MRTRRVALWVGAAATLAVVVALVAWRRPRLLPPAAPARPAPRPVLVLGWDGADPRVVEDLLAAGLMPNLRELRARGTHGRLRSHAPYLSPLLWTSIATGKRPPEHGVLDFVERTAAGGERPVSAWCRRAPPLWRIASDAGHRVVVVNWWASDPPDAVNGAVVSDRAVRGGRSPERVAAGDPSVAQVMARLVRGDGAAEAGPGPPPAVPAGWRDGGRVARLRAFVAETLTMQHVLLARIAELHPDTVFAYSGLPDQAAHLFVQDMPPRQPGIDDAEFRAFGGVVHGCYLFLDALLGDLLRAMPPATQVVLVSDHGFVYGAERARARDVHDPLTDLLHGPEGIYVLAGDAFVAGPGTTLDLYDVAPTVLALLGLAPGRDMAGTPAPQLREPPPAPATSYDGEEARRPLSLLVGQPCGPEDVDASDGAAAEEELEKLRGLGYLGGAETREEPVWPLANYGRALLDAGDARAAEEALGRAALRRPRDARLAFVHLQALLAQPRLDAARIEQAARAALRDEGGTLRPEVAFVLVELLLARGDEAEALALATEAAARGADGALTAMLAAAWTGDAAGARRAALAAAARDPVRTVDTIQALGETVTGVDLGIDALLGAVATAIPLAEVLRAPVGVKTADPRATLARAAGLGDGPADRLWRRRLAAYEVTGRPAPPDASSPHPAAGRAPATP